MSATVSTLLRRGAQAGLPRLEVQLLLSLSLIHI